MKCLIIGGNRFVGLRVSHALDARSGLELHVLNRTGQVAHVKNAVVHKGDRATFASSYLDKDWDVVIDFACFNKAQAEASLNYFGRVGRYIFISTVSVYDAGSDLREEAFQPERLNLKIPARTEEEFLYQDGKRQAEAVFAQQKRFPVLSVRFPFILGPDDYTHRLDFHVERVREGKPIYVVRKEALTSMIHSADAADFILWSLDHEITGPLNVAAAKPISLGSLLAQIELVTGKRPLLADEGTDENHSRYSREEDWFINTGRMNRAGYTARPIDDWLPELIGSPDSAKPKYVH